MFPVSNQSSFLALASELENTGVGAYNGAAPSLTSKQMLTAAGSIVQIEARHAAGDQPADRKEPDAERGLRRAADQIAGARQGGAADQDLGQRLAYAQAVGPALIRDRLHRVVADKRLAAGGPLKPTQEETTTWDSTIQFTSHFC